MKLAAFETTSVKMERQFLLRVQAPLDDVDRIMEHVVQVAPLAMGKYDSNAFQSAAGIERYRPLEGAVAGPETGVRKRPGVVEVSFQLPADQVLLEAVSETIFQVHCYQEPAISVEEVLVSRTKGLDDSANPHRWWNTTGDWKQTAATASPC